MYVELSLAYVTMSCKRQSNNSRTVQWAPKPLSSQPPGYLLSEALLVLDAHVKELCSTEPCLGLRVSPVLQRVLGCIPGMVEPHCASTRSWQT